MKDILGKVLLFTAGAAIGSAVTWKLVKTKYEKIAQEEIDSVKEEYYVKVPENHIVIDSDISDEQGNKCAGEHFHYIHEEKVEKPIVSNEKPDIMEYAAKLKDLGYGKNYAKAKEEPVEEPAERVEYDRPYSIKADEYGELLDYEEVELMYYADGYLTDENDNLVEDIDGTVGFDFADYIGEDEEDVAFIRNDTLRCDYRIDISLKHWATEVNPELLGDYE